jgi:hypothetical protein
MPRYHMDLFFGTTVSDPGGLLYSCDAAARQAADKLVETLRKTRPALRGKGYFVLVRCEGNEIHRALFDRAS